MKFDLFMARSNLLPHAFVWAIYIYIGSIEVTCRSTVAKIVLIGNLRWPPSCLCLLYFPATVLFTCINSWFFRNHLVNFHQISHWSYCWNVIDSLFKRSRSIDCQAHIFFFKTKNFLNDDLFVCCDDRIGLLLQIDNRIPTGDQEVAGSTPPEVSNILSWRLIMKYFLRSFSPFHWFKKGSCQFLAKECAQYWLTA